MIDADKLMNSTFSERSGRKSDTDPD